MYGFIRGSRRVSALSVCVILFAGSFVLYSRSSLQADGAVATSVKGAPATHKQTLVVNVADPSQGQKLEDFCSDTKGQILALLGPADPDQLNDGVDSVAATALKLLGGKKKKLPKFGSAVHVYDSTGKLVTQWPVGFPGQAINLAPDGTILIGGDGKVARFDAAGKKVSEAESPQMTYISKHPDEMRERAKEQLESDRQLYSDQAKQFEEQLKELQKSKKAKPDAKKADQPKDADDEEPVIQYNEQTLKALVQSYKQMSKQMESKTVDDVLNEVMSRAKRIHAISASNENVFVTCPAMAGYGYGVWRTDDKFANAKEIVKSLSGCCGQMDVQCLKGELYVCENSRHRVIRYDRDGKEVAHFGKRDREGEGENFGGCCNPMNLCFSKDGNLYVSESNGVVKHFTPQGKYLGVVGVAEVEPGCKNSCVAVNADDSRLYYIDIEKSKIIVLARHVDQAKK